MHDLGLGDEQAREGHQAALEPWMQGLWKILSTGDTKMTLPSSVQVLNTSQPSQGVPLPAGFSKATVSATHLLTPPNAPRRSHFIRFTDGDKLKYELLDHVLIQPRNAPQLVERLLKRLKLDGEQRVQIKAENLDIPSRVLGRTVSIRELLSEVIDISGRAVHSYMGYLCAPRMLLNGQSYSI